MILANFVILQAAMALGMILFLFIPVLLVSSIIIAWSAERKSNRTKDADVKKRYRTISVVFQIIFVVVLLLVIMLFVINPTID